VANTTWSPTDKTTNLTLSSGNLVASAAAGNQAGRGANGHSSGRFYFEITTTTWGTGNIGVANPAAVFGGSGAVAGSATVSAAGAIFIGSSSAPGTPSLGVVANGSIVGIALDCTGQLLWFRITPSGNWNGNASFAPGGTGGVNIATILTGGVSLFPYVYLAGSPYNVRANFGDSTFNGAVPGGFTSGFPAGSVVLNGPIVTMIG
jgi:hypothetical protein